MVRLTHLSIQMKKTHAGIGQILIGSAKLRHAERLGAAQAKHDKKILKQKAAREAKILRRQLSKVPKDDPRCFNSSMPVRCGTLPKNTYNRCDLCLRRGKG